MYLLLIFSPQAKFKCHEVLRELKRVMETKKTFQRGKDNKKIRIQTDKS